MASRHERLQKKLTEATGYPVYFRAPTGFRIPSYPCIMLDVSMSDCLYADNTVYDGICKYEAVLLTREPYDEGFDKLLLFNHSRLLSSRQFAGINEFTFTIYF